MQCFLQIDLILYILLNFKLLCTKKKIKLVFESWLVKVWPNKGKTKIARKDYFVKNLFSPSFFRQSSLKIFRLIFIQKQKKLLRT